MECWKLLDMVVYSDSPTVEVFPPSSCFPHAICCPHVEEGLAVEDSPPMGGIEELPI
jgi:hypothetical protein